MSSLINPGGYFVSEKVDTGGNKVSRFLGTEWILPQGDIDYIISHLIVIIKDIRFIQEYFRFGTIVAYL